MLKKQVYVKRRRRRRNSLIQKYSLHWGDPFVDLYVTCLCLCLCLYIYENWTSNMFGWE
jgi:hypothetical protein